MAVRPGLASLAVLWLVGACSRPDRFVCEADIECDDGVNGRCEAEGTCSYADCACPSQRRFGASAGERADECTAGQASSHDEDGDAVPDACDRCPAAADPDQRDDDRDGVGDACDPRPTMPGDYILRFESHAGTSDYRFVGTSELRPDVVRLGGPDAQGGANFDVPAPPSRVEVGTRIIDASTSVEHWFGIWYHVEPDVGVPKLFANGSYSPPTSTAYFSIKKSDPPDPMTCPDAAGPARFTAGDVYTLVADTPAVTGGPHVMVARTATQSWSCALSIDIAPQTRGFLEANRIVVDFDYFIAYGIR